jgi:hypothetical protein
MKQTFFVKKYYFLQKHKMSIITIPPPVISKLPENYTEVDCPPPILKVHILGNYNKTNFNDTIINLFNTTTYTIPAFSFQTIYFNNLILTSLPAICCLYGSKYIFKLGLSHTPKLFQTNDCHPNITLYNFTTSTVVLPPNSIQVICNIIITGKYKC